MIAYLYKLHISEDIEVLLNPENLEVLGEATPKLKALLRHTSMKELIDLELFRFVEAGEVIVETEVPLDLSSVKSISCARGSRDDPKLTNLVAAMPPLGPSATGRPPPLMSSLPRGAGGVPKYDGTKYKTRPCKYFLQGHCAEGDNCRFIHPRYNSLIDVIKRPLTCPSFRHLSQVKIFLHSFQS